MRKIILPSVFTAVDKVSSVVNGMGKNVSAYASKTDDAIARSNRKFRKLGNTAFDVAGKSALIGTAIVAPLGLATKAAIDFEDKMADVAKVAGVSLGTKEFANLGESAKTLAVELAVSSEEAAGLMANLAQGGVAVADLDRIGLTAGKVGVAFGISADMAGEAFIKTQNALGGTITETERLMDALNYLGNTTAASSANLLTFMASGGSGVARAANASGESVAAMGAQLISMGKSAEESATIMERFIKSTLESDSLRAVFEKAGGGSEGMLAVIEKGSKLSGKAQDDYFRQFGQYGISLQLLGKNFGDLSTKINAATNSQLTQNSVQQEFANRSDTTAFKLQKMRTQLTNIAISIGDAVLPIIISLTNKISPLIKTISNWAKENRGTVETIVKVAAVMGGLAFTISAVAFGVGLYTKAALIANKAVKAWMATEKLRNAIMSLSPTQKMIGLIGLLATAYISLSRNTSKASIEQKAFDDIQRAVIEKTVNQRIEIDKLFKSLAFAEKGSAKFNSILEKIDQIQPGITKKYNLQEGAIKNLASAHQELIKSIEERARAEAASELYVQAVKDRMLLEQQAKEQAGQSMFSQFIQGFYDYDNTLDRVNERLKEMKTREAALFSVVSGSPTPALNQPQAAMDSQTEKIISANMNSTVDLNLNDPRLSGTSLSPNVKINSSSTK